MKLNIDCVRDVLLEIEEQNVYVNGKIVKPDHHSISNSKRCKRYEMDDIRYTIYELLQSGLIAGTVTPNNENFKISWIDRITPEGHTFIGNIKDDGIFSKIKKALSGFKDIGLSMIVPIAQDIAINYIKLKAGL